MTTQNVDPRTATTAMTRRAMLLSSTAAVAAAALAACGAPGSSGGSTEVKPGGVSSKPVTLSYLNWFGPADPQNVLFPHALKVFQAQHPQVNVEQVVATGSVMEKYLSLAAAGTTPDISALNPQFVEPLRARGALADITPYVKRDGKTWQPEDLNPATVLRAQKNGKWHAIPLQMGLWFLFYNATLLQQAGVAKPDTSWDWDKLPEVVRAVRGRNADVLGMTLPPYELPVRDNGGEILDKDEKKALLDQPQAVEAIQWIGDLRQKHKVSPTPDEMGGQTVQQLWQAGKLAFHVGDPGFLSQSQRARLSFQWDIAVVPKGKVTRVSTVKGPSLILSQESKEKDTGWAWLAHYTGAEMQRFVAVEGKVVSARTSALKAYVGVDEGITKQVVLETAQIAKPMPYVARFDEMDKEIGAGLDSVYSGQRPARDAMAEVVRKVNAILAG
jgi:multiple sugar transport system substrate-binding protein